MTNRVEQRRRILRALGAAGLGLPLFSSSLRHATAQPAGEPTLFVEVCLRTQQCLMHVMVPPGIAKYPTRVVGSNGEQLPMFAPQSELKEYPNGVYLTNDSLELAPHIDTVAMLDTGEAGIGNVHGLEAGNGLRSPGRVMDQGASGQTPMWMIDAPSEGQNGAGSEKIYASAPTPATFHNYYQKQLNPAPLRNGYVFKGLGLFKHECYHFGAGLPGAELDRIKSKPELMTAFADAYAKGGDQPTRLLAQEIAGLSLPPYLKRGGPGEQALKERFAELVPLRPALELTEGEVAYWSQGVPPMKCTAGDLEVMECGTDPTVDPNSMGYLKAQIWEQFAHASKLLRSGLVRSAALEFEYGHLDGDGSRPESVQREYAQQIARPLARFISQMKEAGLYDRTLIAVYTLDGSRRPAANSFGQDGKGTILLAGGRVKGGYYGDILITGDLAVGEGHSYAFQPPDPATGALLPPVSNWADKAQRTPSGSIWRTVVKAMGMPESEYVGKFNKLIDDAVPLDFMLRS